MAEPRSPCDAVPARMTPDVFDDNMRTIITVLILGTLVVGCSTVRERSFGDLLRDTMIPEISFEDLRREDAIKEIQAMWRRQTGNEMPAVQIRDLMTSDSLGIEAFPKEYDPEQNRIANITFRATNISFYEALSVMGAIVGCDFCFLGVQEPGSFGPELCIGNYGGAFMAGVPDSMGWRLDASTKAGLDLGEKPDGRDIRRALELRGVDCSKGNIRIIVANDVNIWIGGDRDKVALAKAIFVLSQNGYQIRKRQKSQQYLNIAAQDTLASSRS